MKLKDLKRRGAIITGDLVKKSVTWTHADEATGDEVDDQFDIYVVKRLTFGAFDRIWGQALDQSKAALLIAECVRLGDEGEERLSYDDAYRLHPGLATVFMEAVKQVHEEHRHRMTKPTGGDDSEN